MSAKPSSSSAVICGFAPGSLPGIEAVRIMPPNTSQGGTSSSRDFLRPGEPAAADQSPIHVERVGPFDIDGGFRRRGGRERVGERRHAGVEDAARLPQRLLRFQHQREFGEIEAADIDQRAGAVLGRERNGMRKCVAQFAQPHRACRAAATSIPAQCLSASASGIDPRPYFLV